MSSLLRFLRTYGRSDATDLDVTETCYNREGLELPATVYRPKTRKRLPGWVVLHGLTFTGREHPSLVRFARAVAAAGNVVFVPELPEWRALRVAPGITHETIRSAVRALHDRDDTVPERQGLFGFSFGATQALIAAADPGVSSLLRMVAAWGGYSDVHRLFQFGITGEFDFDGKSWRVPPDPYGSWIMSGSYLTAIPGYEGHSDVAEAALALAREAGRRRVYSRDASYDDVKRELRENIAPEHVAVFDLIAPLSTAGDIDLSYGRMMARKLADAALSVDPMMDAQPFLGRVGTRVLLAHGRDDRLVPFTETLRTARALPPERLAGTTITALFAHSGGTNQRLGPVGKAREGVRFLGVLGRILHSLEPRTLAGKPG